MVFAGGQPAVGLLLAFRRGSLAKRAPSATGAPVTPQQSVIWRKVGGWAGLLATGAVDREPKDSRRGSFGGRDRTQSDRQFEAPARLHRAVEVLGRTALATRMSNERKEPKLSAPAQVHPSGNRGYA